MSAAKQAKATSTPPPIQCYEGEADQLVRPEQSAEQIHLLPPATGKLRAGERIRILWGQDMLRDLLDGRYRAVICGVNDHDNSHGIIAQLVELVQASQWSAKSVTSFARMFQESVAVHAAHDREPYILKYDLDSVLILALLRPKGRDHFTLEDISRGFVTCNKMLRDRRERLPVASVSFLNARVNRLKGAGAHEPSFEEVLKTMFHAGYRGDIYPPPTMWRLGHVGVFPSYPFPDSLHEMREGGH
jgi:hypothetical protein